MSREEWIEENRDALEKRYHEMYMMTLGDCEAFKKFEKALVEIGILEPDEDEPEDINNAPHWDEWCIDQKVDISREMAFLGYEE